ncbi:hypothetical protein ACFPRL_18405 [Pseudoclavibacter helvolus]
MFALPQIAFRGMKKKQGRVYRSRPQFAGDHVPLRDSKRPRWSGLSAP